MTPITPPASASVPPAAPDDGDVTLEPRFWVPLGVTLLGPASLLLSPLWHGSRWLCLALVVFGGFLLLQSALLRLVFAQDALLVLRSGREIRRFPYREWLGWRLFWQPVPVLFYFREERSIHLLPMLFDASTLRDQLAQRLAAAAPSSAR